MKLTTKIACLLATVAFAAPAAAVTVDFEEFTQTSTIMAGVDYMGITFDQNIQVGQLGFLDGPATDNYIARGTQPLGGTVSGTFAGSVSMLTLGAGDVCCDVDNVTLTGFDAMGTLVDSDSFSGAASQYLSISGPGIVSFIIQQTSGGFDNITFDLTPTSVVPLPASLPLLLAGLCGLALHRRRKS